MANTKISALASGSPAQSTDAVAIARSGANFKLALSDFLSLILDGMTFVGTNATTMTFPSTSATIARTDAANTFIGHQTIEGVTSAGAIGTGNLVFSISPAFTGTVALPIATLSGVITNYNGIATQGNGVPSEPFRIAAFGLNANYNSGSAKTLITPATATMLRISYSQAIQTPGSSSSTFPSLTLGWTDAGGIARTKVLVATSSANLTTVESDGVVVIYTNVGTAVTITSASYASSGATPMAYEFAVSAEIL